MMMDISKHPITFLLIVHLPKYTLDTLHLPELKVFSQFQKLCQLMKINVVCCSQCCIPILEVLALGELEQVKRLIKNYF